MNGTIKQYYRGMGWIIGENGEEFFLHNNDLLRKEKHYKRGRAVTFEPVDDGREHRRATNVYVETPEPVVKPRSGRGEWVNTPEKGRIRCSDCGCTTDQGETPYCPHCGAVMHKDLPSNEAELTLRANRTPLWKWHKLEYGYRCGHCKLINPFPNMFCPRCGTYMEKFSENL